MVLHFCKRNPELWTKKGQKNVRIVKEQVLHEKDWPAYLQTLLPCKIIIVVREELG
jgi:hypothetical protein